MAGAQYFGYGLIAVSAMLLAQHWFQWRDWRTLAPGRRREILREQLQRRFVASALIGVVGAAMTLVDHVPRRPVAMSAYLFALLLGGGVIFLIALADIRSMRRLRDEELLDVVAAELQKAAGEER
jgi:TRAP-type C4-dicarboxylate transport system permease small subunit